jgi:penicillin G amidase
MAAGVLTVGTLAVGALGLAATASARVLRAEAILPPGQSGFVSLTGLANGTGSPHLYDQQQPFIAFERRNFDFSRGGTVEAPRPGVAIARDAYGIPRISASNDADVWWGAGYAVAEDRLFQLDLFRRATTGRLAEILGSDYLDDDVIARRDYYTPAEMDAMLAAVPAGLRARIDAYRDGINAYIAQVQLNPLLLPGEFAATGDLPIAQWTDRDSVAVGIFLARTVPSGDGNELSNLRAVKEGGSKVLNALLPLRLPREVITIPRANGLWVQGKPLTRRQERSALKRSLRFAASLPTPSEQQAGASAAKKNLAPGSIGRVGGSSMFAVRKRGGGALLFNGPQLGFSVPELFVELEIHRPGLDVRGVTAPGVPVIGIGHNGSVAWGFTSGLSDEDDLYAEKLVPGQPEKYIFKGEVKTMSCRDEVFDYRTPPSDIIGGATPAMGSETHRICRTIHGPVQERAEGVAYARRYAIWGQELETLQGIADLNAAHDIRDVDRAMREVTWNENVIAADSAGNIGYWHPGLFQLRPRGWDERLPYPGTGDAEWRGLLARSKTPHVVNPKQGWLANWNNMPSAGWTNGDGESTERVTGQYHRAGFFFRLVRRVARHPTFEQARAAVREEGSTAQQRPLLTAQLRRAARGAKGKAATLLSLLLGWDGNYTRTDRDGKTDPGVTAWQEFKKQATRMAADPFGKAAVRFGLEPNDEHLYDVSDPTAYALRTLKPVGYRQAAEAAFDELAARFRSSEPSAWRTPRAMFDMAVQGAGSPPPMPFFDRGTWEQIVELGP